jgi:Domain of unknown function (DUF4160)
MYYRDHHPPHFHAIYAEYEAQIAEYEAQIVIETLEPLAGELPARALKLVPGVGWGASRGAGGELGECRGAPAPGYD